MVSGRWSDGVRRFSDGLRKVSGSLEKFQSLGKVPDSHRMGKGSCNMFIGEGLVKASDCLRKV